MSGRLRHIKRTYPQKVKILIGAPVALVSIRELRTHYQTNREIKYWATWFLLKALTTTSKIQYWTSHKAYLLGWLQMNENTFRAHLAWLKDQGLLSVDKTTFTLNLGSYEAAADVLGIAYAGTFEVGFDPALHPGKQTFQYLLRTEECEHHKLRQLQALAGKLDHNPAYFKDMLYQLVELGGDQNRLLSDTGYFIRRLLLLQTQLFKEGSELLRYAMLYRADVNRGVRRIRQHHSYRSEQSVSYMKRRMWLLGFAQINKPAIVSQARARFYIPGEEPGGRDRDGYKYVKATGRTVWFLTDQIQRRYPVRGAGDLVTQKKQRYAA
jgi:hypothetical protein